MVLRKTAAGGTVRTGIAAVGIACRGDMGAITKACAISLGGVMCTGLGGRSADTLPRDNSDKNVVCSGGAGEIYKRLFNEKAVDKTGCVLFSDTRLTLGTLNTGLCWASSTGLACAGGYMGQVLAEDPTCV